MGMYGRHTVERKDGRRFVVEPISTHAMRNSDWGHKDLSNKPIGGGVHPDDSIITKENGFKNIVVLGPGVSPYSYIDSL